MESKQNQKILRLFICEMNNADRVPSPINERKTMVYNTTDATPIGVITNNSKRNPPMEIFN